MRGQRCAITSTSEQLADVTANQASPVRQAVVWLRKARNGSIKWVDMCSDQQYEYYLLSKRTKFVGTIGKFGLLFVTIFDMPSWCRGTPLMCATYVKQLYAPQFPCLPQRFAAGISLFFWACIAVRLLLRKLTLGDAYNLSRWTAFAVAMVSIGSISALVSIFVPVVYNLSVVCRPFVFMATTKTLRVGSQQIVRSLPGFFDVLVSMAICVFVFLWVAMVLYAKTAEGKQWFPSWYQGFNQMWILYTLNNTPDITLPASNTHPANIIFFGVYAIIVTYILSSVLLARVYDSYKDVVKADFMQFNENQRVGITRAFSLLSDISIQEKTWHEFFHLFCDPYVGCVEVADPEDREHNIEAFEEILRHDHGLHFDPSEGINLDKFKQVLHVCFSGVQIHRRRRSMVDESPGSLVHFFRHGTTFRERMVDWDTMVDLAIVVNCSLSFWEAFEFRYLIKRHLPLTDSTIYWLMLALSVFFVAELSAKIWAFGLQRYWNHKPVQHRSDMFIVYVTLILEIAYVFFPLARLLERAIIIFHMFRGLRLVTWIQPLEEFFTLVVALVPAYSQMTAILFIVFWFFTDIGQLWFGGMIYTSNPRLAGSEFAADQLWALNFNDFISSLVTLFTLMVQDDWNEIANGYTTVTGSPWPTAYFVGFCVVINMIVLNILVALILDCSGALSEAQAEAAEAQRAQEEAEEDAEFTGTESQGIVKQETLLRKIVGADDDYFGRESSSSSGSSSGGKEAEDSHAVTSVRPLINSKFIRHSMG